uniref:G-protein coupled receptors family 2 profile 2 domain-containing protein n=1 Tax=Stegastes partitus TaxID=144197 RepID=A0A3B5AZY0_9TELE
DGCETDNSTYNDQQDKKIICSSDHATPFAVLLVRKHIQTESYLACGVVICLCVFVFLFLRNHKLDYSISIHVSLSGALFLLNTTFLLTEWGATVDLDWVCVFIAVSLHYSLLCCFTWMAIEALHLYLLLIKVFNTYYKHYMLKLSLAGWGDVYCLSHSCWITDDSFFYSLNLVYFSLIFIFNTGILMAVASSICKMKQVYKSNSKLGAGAKGKSWSDSQRFSASCRSGLTLMGLTCLMGTTWGLAFLGSGYTPVCPSWTEHLQLHHTEHWISSRLCTQSTVVCTANTRLCSHA